MIYWWHNGLFFIFLIRLYDILVAQWTFFPFLIRLYDILVAQWTFFFF